MIVDEIIDDEVPKHKKKSKAKGLPRSNHKHKYITVALYVPIQIVGKEDVQSITKGSVCEICGRIDDFGFGWHIEHFRDTMKTKERLLKKYPKWYTNNMFDKFAKKIEDKEED
jgi:hypothetical protein